MIIHQMRCQGMTSLLVLLFNVKVVLLLRKNHKNIMSLLMLKDAKTKDQF